MAEIKETIKKAEVKDEGKKATADSAVTAAETAGKKTTAAKTTAAKTTAAKTPAKKAAAKSTAKKTTARTKTAAKTAAKSNETVLLQFAGKEINVEDIKKSVADALKESKVSAKKVEIYVKPDDNKAYYVAGDVTGSIDL